MGYTIKDILRLEVIPALGCTEPAAVGLAAAAAAAVLPGKDLSAVEVWLDPGIYKNASGVAIPGTRGEYGIDLAAALGAMAGDAGLRLEVFKPIDAEALRMARDFINAGRVRVNLLHDRKGIYVRARIKGECDEAEAVIENAHDALTSLSLNGKTLMDHPLLSSPSGDTRRLRELEAWLAGRTLEELTLMLDGLDGDDMAFIEEGVRCNLALAEHGLKFGPGLGIGLMLERLVREGLLKKDMIMQARILTSAASDARMSGVKLPAMSSAGSGNHGLTAILPIWAVKDYIICDDPTRVLRSIALSHVLTGFIKAHTGRLSAVCGCSVAAGAGAAGGIAYLMNGTLRHIAGAIKNLIEDLAGVICDGAKAGCSLKLATAAGTAVQAALFALHGIEVQATDGIIAATPEQTMRNVGELSCQGMLEADRTILRIMLAKQFIAG